MMRLLDAAQESPFLPSYQQKIETRSDVELQRAAAAGDEASLRACLDSGRVHVDCADPEGTTALMLAAAHNHVTCLRLLVEEGAEVTAQRETGTHALFFAAQAGSESAVRWLVEEAGAPVNLPSKDGATPLSVAAQCGHVPVAAMLLKHGANPEAPMLDGATPLFLAAQNGHAEAARLLLAKGALPDAARLDGASPLWIAAQTGHPQILRLLLSAGADSDRARNDGATPLFKAAHKGNRDVVAELLEWKPSLGLLENGESALHAACLFGHLPIVQLLVEHGAKPLLKNRTGETPLELAEQMGYEQIVNYLAKFRPPRVSNV